MFLVLCCLAAVAIFCVFSVKPTITTILPLLVVLSLLVAVVLVLDEEVALLIAASAPATTTVAFITPGTALAISEKRFAIMRLSDSVTWVGLEGVVLGAE